MEVGENSGGTGRAAAGPPAFSGRLRRRRCAHQSADSVPPVRDGLPAAREAPPHPLLINHTRLFGRRFRDCLKTAGTSFRTSTPPNGLLRSELDHEDVWAPQKRRPTAITWWGDASAEPTHPPDRRRPTAKPFGHTDSGPRIFETVSKASPYR